MITQKQLQNYARLAVRIGVNLQKGQELVVSIPVECAEFARLVTKEAYDAGAKRVKIKWADDTIARLNMERQDIETVQEIPQYVIDEAHYEVDNRVAFMFISAADPELYLGIDMAKIKAAQMARIKALKFSGEARSANVCRWTIVSLPTEKWAKKIFPNERASVAIERLWEAILCTSRVDDDPIAAWERHNADLAKRCEYLNSLGITELKYKAGNGTDLVVGLIPDGIFMGGGENAQGSGIYFNPNIPSEEVFTSPMKGKAEGIVYSSRPLCCNGALIENFWIRFEGGKAVEVGAQKNENVLRELIAMDENAGYLGECALVPYSSPIRESGLLFYNTLFDENAACHLALGRGFTNLLRGYENMSEDEAHAAGINDSIVHEDFMIGTADMSIIALTRDGKEVPIFENGEWAF